MQQILVLLLKMTAWTQDVKTEDLLTALLSLVVWSAIMELVKGLGQSTSVTITLREMRSQGYARVMVPGMGAHQCASQPMVSEMYTSIYPLHN